MAKKRVKLVNNYKEILMSGDFEAFKKVFDKCEINAKYKDTNAFGGTPLTREFAFWLKEQGCDIEFKGSYDKTPIFEQVTRFEENIDLFVELGANIYAKDSRGATVLHMSANYGNKIAIEKLLGYGMDVDLKTEKTIFLEPHTPLEYALIYGSTSADRLLEITEFMVSKGATITEKVKETIIKHGEDFAFRKDSMSNQEFAKQSQINFNKLYENIGVEPLEEVIKHDGVADIVVKGKNFTEKYNNLYDFVVPGSGRAKSAQGECVRLIDRLSYEILNNGGANWCNDFILMAKAFNEYLSLGNSLDEKNLAVAEKIISKISINTTESDITKLRNISVKWVALNPKVLPFIDAKYKR